MIKVKILRQKSPSTTPYWQTFDYNGTTDCTVAHIIDVLNSNDDLFDENGKSAPRIQVECGCYEGICGACAMVINGRPRLACLTTLEEAFGKKLHAKSNKNNPCVLELRPLSKFPCIHDLIIDRSVISEVIRDSSLWVDIIREVEGEHDFQYVASKCLKCGLCLEVCPNYGGGNKFYGPILANEAYLVCSLEGNEKHRNELIKEYNKHFSAHCSKSLACMSVCPIDMQTLASMSWMNKQLH